MGIKKMPHTEPSEIDLELPSTVPGGIFKMAVIGTKILPKCILILFQ